MNKRTSSVLASLLLAGSLVTGCDYERPRDIGGRVTTERYTPRTGGLFSEDSQYYFKMNTVNGPMKVNVLDSPNGGIKKEDLDDDIKVGSSVRVHPYDLINVDLDGREKEVYACDVKIEEASK